MSSHTIQADEPRFEIYLGWDPMLNTYFLHVINTSRDEDEEERDALWIGCMPNEILDLDVIDVNLRRFVKAGLPKDLKQQIYKEANE